jgi:hypothetical protein
MNTVVGPVRWASLIVLIGLLGVEAASPRRGPVRTEGYAVADAAGPFNALGATLFWGAWGYKFDRARLERNLAALSGAGVDYVRVLGAVGGTSWEDRETDPGWKDYDSVIAGMTDLAYDRYGMRVQWTLFGGSPSTPGGPSREALVDRFAKLARGREEKLFAFEIANEARSNGFPGPEGLAELRRLGTRLNEQTTVLVALSAPATHGACDTYADAGADAATIHYPRSFGSEGPLLPLRQPWRYPAKYHAKCAGQLPPVVFNNEPIGPESSVHSDDDPSRIVAGYAMTFLANNAAYVLHAGPGIRGGGVADVSGKLQRHAHFDELPSFRAIASGLSAAKSYLPAGLANWTRHEPGGAAAPVYGSAHVYSASSGPAFVVLVMGAGEPEVLRARAASMIAVRAPSTGKILRHLEVEANASFSLPSHETLILTGRTKGP